MISLKMDLKDILKDLSDVEEKTKSPFKNIDNSIENKSIYNIDIKTPVDSGELKDGNKSKKISDKNILLYNDVEYSPYVNDHNEFFYLDDDVIDEIEEIVIDNILED